MPLKDFEKTVLTEDNLDLVDDFDCNASDEPDFEKLNTFLKEKALEYNQSNFSRTTIYSKDGACAAYYSLSMNAIKEKKIDVEEEYQSLKSYPALFLTRFAIDKRYQHSGIGKAIINDIISNAYKDKHVAARFLFVDANPKSVSWYLGNRLFTILYFDLNERINQCIESQIIKELNNRLIKGQSIECVLDDGDQLHTLRRNCEKILIGHANKIFEEISSEFALFKECESKIKMTFEDNKPKIKLDNFNTRQNHSSIRDWLKNKNNVLKLDITIPLYLDINKYYTALFPR